MDPQMDTTPDIRVIRKWVICERCGHRNRTDEGGWELMWEHLAERHGVRRYGGVEPPTGP